MSSALALDAERNAPEPAPEGDDFDRHMAESALLAMKVWLAPFDSKFYEYGYTMMFMKLIASPGLKKSELALFLENEAKVSRSTAERFIKEAADAGYIVINNPEGRPGLEIVVSDETREHFHTAFQDTLDRGAQRLQRFQSRVTPLAAAGEGT